MRRCLPVLILVMITTYTYAQDAQEADTTYWTRSLKGVFGINQSSFVNWQAGGENTFAWNVLGEGRIAYRKGKHSWKNRLKLGYGSINQKSTGFRKNDDVINFESSYGYYFNPNKERLLWSTSLSFLTQFADGFNYPNDSTKISTFMAPGYLLIDTGIEYKVGDKFSMVYSPLAAKMTFVNDDSLSSSGAFGVDPGSKFRNEIGTSFKIDFTDEIVKNIKYTGGLLLFTDYQESFGNIDVFFTNLFVFKINDFFATTLSFDFIYDDDITITETDENGNVTGMGPRLQYKQVLSLGLTLNLDSKKE